MDKNIIRGNLILFIYSVLQSYASLKTFVQSFSVKLKKIK